MSRRDFTRRLFAPASSSTPLAQVCKHKKGTGRQSLTRPQSHNPLDGSYLVAVVETCPCGAWRLAYSLTNQQGDHVAHMSALAWIAKGEEL